MRTFLAIALFATASVLPSYAQDETVSGGLAIELNAVQSVDAGCRVTFLAVNNFDAELVKASVETALFDASGAIERIVTLDFKALSPGKTKVLQFELAGLNCTNLGRVLINDITACEGEGLTPGSCLAGLTTSARPEIAFGA